MNSYSFLKGIHLACVALSLVGFLIRYILMLRQSPLLGKTVARVLPHINDTILLSAALGLAFQTSQFPFVDHWLTAKVCGLLAYILCGTIALKRGSTIRIRAVAGVGGILCFAYVVSVALTRSPCGPFAISGACG